MGVPDKYHWKFFKKYPLNHYNDGFWQKIIEYKGEEIGIDAVMYSPRGPILSWAYELHIQIPFKISITGKTININNFSYTGENVNFKQVEEHTLAILEGLTKKDNTRSSQ